MPPKNWPPEARRLNRVLYEDENFYSLHDLPLVKGITESFFVELVVGCLYNYIERAKKFSGHDKRIHRGLWNKKGIQKLQRMSKHWLPAAARLADLTLKQNDDINKHHDEVVGWAKAEADFFDPALCLYVLFRYLVKTKPDRKIEYYMDTDIPEILMAAGLKPPRAEKWESDNIWRRIRRRGGQKTVEFIAFYLFSTDDRLKPFRPPRPAYLQKPDTTDPEFLWSVIGHSLFRVPHSRKAIPLKPLRGGQHPTRSG